jgi:hypothetical protein
VLTQIRPDVPYHVHALFLFDLPGITPSKTEEELNALFDRELTDFGAQRVSYHRAEFTADAKRIGDFIHFVRRLAKEGTFYLAECDLTQPPRSLDQLAEDDWLLIDAENSCPYQGLHDGQVHAMRIPDSRHLIENGTRLSEQVLKWLQRHCPEEFVALPLRDVSPVQTQNWFAICPHHYLGPGLDHLFRNPTPARPYDEKAFPPDTDRSGEPWVKIGVTPEGDFPIVLGGSVRDCNAREDAQLTDPLLRQLAQSTLRRTLELQGAHTFLRDQTPRNANIAWAYDHKGHLALRAHLARGLQRAGLATSDMFAACDTVDSMPQGCERLANTRPPLFYYKRGFPNQPVASDAAQIQIKTPTWDDVIKALDSYAAYHQTFNKRQRPFVNYGHRRTPALWKKLVTHPHAGLIAELPFNPQDFNGRIKNPDALPPHSSLLDVAGDGGGDTFLLVVPPAPNHGSLKVALRAWIMHPKWEDCPVAWYESGKIVCIWPSIIHFALDRIADQRARDELDQERQAQNKK